MGVLFFKNMKIKIKSKKIEGKFLHCDFLENKNAEKIVVLLSGLSGSKNLPLFGTASSAFFKNGFSTLRINFCNDPDNKHQIIDTPDIRDANFAFYSAELKNILEFFKKKYTNIVIIGHSFGAPVAVMFLSTYKSYATRVQLILWDPSLLPFDKKAMDSAFVFDLAQKLYREKEAKLPYIFNKKFYKELSEDIHTGEVLRNLNKEVCIIGAMKGAGQDAKKYFSKLKNKKISKLILISSANHMFDGRRVQKELLKKTFEFLGTESK